MSASRPGGLLHGRTIVVTGATGGLGRAIARVCAREGARIGTGSMRRRCQLLAQRPDLRVEPVRGNIDTRLKKLLRKAQ